jgi:hypothetical protein
MTYAHIDPGAYTKAEARAERVSESVGGLFAEYLAAPIAALVRARREMLAAQTDCALYWESDDSDDDIAASLTDAITDNVSLVGSDSDGVDWADLWHDENTATLAAVRAALAVKQ